MVLNLNIDFLSFAALGLFSLVLSAGVLDDVAINSFVFQVFNIRSVRRSSLARQIQYTIGYSQFANALEMRCLQHSIQNSWKARNRKTGRYCSYLFRLFSDPRVSQALQGNSQRVKKSRVIIGHIITCPPTIPLKLGNLVPPRRLSNFLFMPCWFGTFIFEVRIRSDRILKFKVRISSNRILVHP